VSAVALFVPPNNLQLFSSSPDPIESGLIWPTWSSECILCPNSEKCQLPMVGLWAQVEGMTAQGELGIKKLLKNNEKTNSAEKMTE
jgi:hypothetical protein